MELLINHPTVAGRSCKDCAKYLYDEKTGERVKIEKSTGRSGTEFKFMERPPQIPTPCFRCPKISPEKAHEVELSSKNLKSWDYYWKARAPLGHKLPADETTHRNMMIIHELVSQAERKREFNGLASSVAGAVVGAVVAMSQMTARR